MPRGSNSQVRHGLDWINIRDRFMAGESAYAIEKALGGRITRQRIRQVAKKEGWDEALAAGKPSEVVKAPSGRHPAYKDTPDRRETILEAVAGGMPRSHAAQYAGISRDTLKNWCRKDSDFETALMQAERAFQRSKLGEIDQAGKRGDWKASAYMLEKHPVTKADYASKAEAGGGVTINVQLNIPRADLGGAMAIDITPDDQEKSPGGGAGA